MFRHIIIKAIESAITALKINKVDFMVEHPENRGFGDYSTNVAFILSKTLKTSPMVIAEEIAKNIQIVSPIAKVKVEKPGFINFWLEKSALISVLGNIVKERGRFGSNNSSNNRILVEYTDPNPFKEFHIGHLMSNAIGESLSRILAFNGNTVKRACYQGDVGMHIAKALWGFKEILKKDKLDLSEVKKRALRERVHILGRGYAYGASQYIENEFSKKEIENFNKAIYEKSDGNLYALYKLGRQWSLEYFETLYRKLGTKFDYYFFESQTSEIGLSIVENNIKTGVFVKSGGAIIFRGEKFGLHTRVFVNKFGIPTYEAKDLGLSKLKYDTYKYDISLVLTGNEIVSYFKVVLKALSLIYPDLAKKTFHIPHGMLRLKNGKMSSRTGKVVTGESLISRVEKELVNRVENIELGNVTPIAVGAIKYSVLRQGLGKDVAFDFKTSLSFEGDSGPYLQYTYARCKSVLRNVKGAMDIGGVCPNECNPNKDEEKILRHIYKFPEVVEKAGFEYSPNLICTFLFELAKSYNAFYANNSILKAQSKGKKRFRVFLTQATAQVLENGLKLLGISPLEKM